MIVYENPLNIKFVYENPTNNFPMPKMVVHNKLTNQHLQLKKYNTQVFLETIVIFFIIDAQPFRMVEDESLKNFCIQLKPLFLFSSRFTISRYMIKKK